MVDVEITRVRTREERDAEGWANAIVLSSDEDEPAPPSVTHASGVGLSRSTPVSAALPSGALGKRPLAAASSSAGYSTQPDIKQHKVAGGASLPSFPPAPANGASPSVFPPAWAPAVARPTELKDGAVYGAPPPFAQGASRDSPRHAGHLSIRLSAPAPGSDGFFSASSAGSSHVVIGSGMEVSATSLLGALPWDVRVDDGTPGAELFGALGRLADPRNTQVGRRPGVPLVGVAWQPGLPWRLERGKPAVSVRLDVYLMPEIFELKISTYSGTNSCFYDIWLLFDNLVPTKPFKPTPRPPPVASDAALAPCGAAAPARHRAPPSAHAFTLAGLMRAMESAGYDEMDGPDGLNLELYPFQRQSLKWMYDRETQPGGLNSLFWREHPSDKGRGVDHSFWYNPMAGELRAAKPPVVTGGFLCEEMGLGKTVEMCALILANPYVSSGPQQGRAPLRLGVKDVNRPMKKTKATLVVVPVVLLHQWRAEVIKCVGDRLSVYVHHGENAKKVANRSLKPFVDADIVLTTYEHLRIESTWTVVNRALLRMHWWRLVLDESQRVPKPANERSAMTAIAKACSELSRAHTWCMSGTPVGSVVDDLLGQLIVLGVQPYCDRGENGDAFWEREVSGRWRAHDAEALEIVHDLLGQIMMRHSKAQTMVGADGSRSAIVSLPKKTEVTTLLHLTDASERAVYGELERMCADDLRGAIEAEGELAAAMARGAGAAEIARLRKVAQSYRREDLLTPRDLQHVATHVSSLNLDALTGLEKKLTWRKELRPGDAASRARPAASAAAPSLGPKLLCDLASSATGARGGHLRAILDDHSKQRCGLCFATFGGGATSDDLVVVAKSPRVTTCGHLFCTPCLKAAARGRAGDDSCPECAAPDAGLRAATLLHTPLNARSVAEADPTDEADTASLPTVMTSPWDLDTPPSASRLAELKLWQCSGAPCHDADGSKLTQLATVLSKADEAAEAAAAEVMRGGGNKRNAKAAADHARASFANAIAAASVVTERSADVQVDGMHFCSVGCAEARFKRSLVPYCSVCKIAGHQNNARYSEPELDADGEETGEMVDRWLHPPAGMKANIVRYGNFNSIVGPKVVKDGYCTVGFGWGGTKLVGKVYPNWSEAKDSLRDAMQNDPSQKSSRPAQWEGDDLYPPANSDAPFPERLNIARLGHVANFPGGAPRGLFLAHLDAAGAPRSYGMHWPYHVGTKASAVLLEVAQMRARGGKDKMVVFSDCKAVLEVLHEALRRSRGDGSVARVLGDTGFDQRMAALAKFKQSAGCYVLLLAVGACASGLTLTEANRCVLLDLQSHEGRELQLINRVWRIGQEKPVTVTRLVAAGTVEERMLHLRARSRGLLATEDADSMTVARVGDAEAGPPSATKGSAKGKAPAKAPATEPASERSDELRYLYGLN